MLHSPSEPSDHRLLRLTSNRTGWTSDLPNQISTAFIEFAKLCKEPVLDIGAAYGVASIPALVNGSSVLANDLELGHLRVLREKVALKDRERLMLVVGRFPDLGFTDSGFDAIHASNILHFLRGFEFELGAKMMFRWLRRGGRVFIQTGSPYVGHLENCIVPYEQRKANGSLWPGEFDDVLQRAAHEYTQYLPPFLNLVDPEVLERPFTEAGFNVEFVGFYRRVGLPSEFHYDGREQVGLIATKP